jgi:hypothetical protein
MQCNTLTQKEPDAGSESEFEELDTSEEAKNFLDTYGNDVNSDVESTDTKEVTQYHKREENSGLDK